MPVMTAHSSRRIVLVLAALAVVLAAAVDLLRRESLLRSAWARLTPDRETPAQQRLEELQRSRVRPVRP